MAAAPLRRASRRPEDRREPAAGTAASRPADVSAQSCSDKPAAAPPGVADLILVGWTRESTADHLAAIRELQAAAVVRLRALVHRSEQARSAMQAYFPEAATETSLDAVVAPPGSLVVVGSAPGTHVAMVNAAMKRGWHVLCSSPLASSSAEAATMMAAARRHERTLAVDLHRRFFPAAQFLRSLCRDHLLGPVVSFEIHEGSPPPPSGEPAAAAKSDAPDGALIELGAPALDLLGWCLGRPSLQSYADDAMGGVEANALIRLTFPEAVHGTVHLSRSWPTSNTWEFVFERGRVRWDVNHANRLNVQLASAPASVEGLLLPPLTRESGGSATALPSRAQATTAQLRHAIAAIGGTQPLRVPATEALHTLALIEECHARRTLLEQGWLTRNETARARSLSAPTGLRRP